MPTLNPQLKISTSCGPNLSTYRRNEAEEKQKSTLNDDQDSDSPAGSSGTSNKTTNFIKSEQYDKYLRHKVDELRRTHVISNPVQRNASDTSLLWTCEQGDSITDCGKESNTNDVKLNRLSNAPERVTDPSLIPGNLRNARMKSASQIMDEFFSRGSIEQTQGSGGGKPDFLQTAKIKAKRKPLRSSKQQINKQKERVNSTVPDIRITKSTNPIFKSVQNTKSGPLCPAVEDRVSIIKSFSLRGKVNSDLSINVAPYSQKSSTPKDHLSPYQSNSYAARNKNCKRAANSFERLVGRKAAQENDQIRLKKVYLTKIQSRSHDVDINEQYCPKQNRHPSCENGSVLADIKPRGSTHPVPKLEAKGTQRERTNGVENRHAEVMSKVTRYESKRKQRREIYALNKVMTELENERFILFMQDIGSGTGSV